jgi:phospholipase/carboxylesterase
MNVQSVAIEGWQFQIRQPQGDGLHTVTLMLHGWTGDETAMWVFASRLPPGDMLIAPRGLYETPHGGYGWHTNRVKAWPWVDDFQPAIEALLGILLVENFPQADLDRFRIVGFSQGAALAFSLALLHPTRVGNIAALSGFLPDGASALARNKPLQGKQIFMAHGSQDHLVPVDRAREAVRILQSAGSQVTYCEDDVGHKLSRGCFRSLQYFFSES